MKKNLSTEDAQKKKTALVLRNIHNVDYASSMNS